MSTVIDISEDTSLVVDLTRVGVISNGPLHDIEDDSRLVLDEVDGTASQGGGRLATVRAAFEG